MRELARRLALLLLLTTSAALGADAEQHFAMGIKLYEQKNFAGALAEFEEAYKLRPTPSSLQNIALCQRAMFRYAEAIDTLERMLRDHGAGVDPEDARAAREAIDEMRPMVATTTLRVEPSDAVVTVDGRPVPGGAERTVRLNVGEHRLVAEAPRYQRFDQMMSFAGGARTLDVRLESDAGEVTILAEDAEAAIAVDGVPRSFGTWTGELSAGQHHVVQVYKTGFTTTTLEITLERGERRTVRAALGPATKDASTPFPYRPPPSAPVRRGFFGLLTATNYFLASHPDGFAPPKSDNSRDGTYFGLRLGYRFTNNFAVEAMGEFGKHTIGPGCYTPPKAPNVCDPLPPDNATYEFWGRRFGANARFMTSGERFRFLGILGVGGSHHRLRLTTAGGNTGLTGEGSALNAYILAEAGFELSFGGALVDGVLALAVDGVNNLAIGASSTRVYTDQRNISMAGLGIRIGYGHWLPRSHP